MNQWAAFCCGILLFGCFSNASAQIEQPPVPFIEVISGCTSHGGRCVNIRSGPGTDYPVVKTLRMGGILEIDGVVYRESRAWYRIKHDTNLRYPERVKGEWYIASDFTKMHTAGREAIAPATNAKNKTIVVNLKLQTLSAFEGTELFMNAKVSTGITKTPTPKGTFKIFKKKPSRYMQGPLPHVSDKYYDLPGVPWTMYFTQDGAAIHGTYWHQSFGTQRSNGCINLPVDLAEKLYAWAPIGTRVIVK
ncbi:MAG: hypothetical protein RI911_354 [Candidatus Parcubacteria bacterium]|jgi:lipoprotein-anchoring transpeptidase ErfK/SrfK